MTQTNKIKIYALLFQHATKQHSHLTMVQGNTMEEAIRNAEKKDNLKWIEWTLAAYQSAEIANKQMTTNPDSVKQIIPITKLPIKQNEPSWKDKLIEVIIHRKEQALFEANKRFFSQDEIKMIEDKMK